MESFFWHAKDESHLRRRAAFGDVAAEIEDHVHFRRINVAICPPWFIRNWT